MAVEPSRFGPEFHCVTVSRDVFEVRSHYVNLRPVGGGSYGIVCSAEDTVRFPNTRRNGAPADCVSTSAAERPQGSHQKDHGGVR